MQKVCKDTYLAGTTGGSAQCGTLTPTVCWKFLRARYVNLSELLLGYLHVRVCLHPSELLLGDLHVHVCLHLGELLLGDLHAQVCLHLGELLLGDLHTRVFTVSNLYNLHKCPSSASTWRSCLFSLC